MRIRAIVLAGLAFPALVLHAQERAIPFWPDDLPAAIHSEIDGNEALETVRELSRFHRVHGSPGFAAAAEHMKKKLLAAGLADAAVERFPADGKTQVRALPQLLRLESRLGDARGGFSAAGPRRVVPGIARRARRLQPGRRRHGGARGRGRGDGSEELRRQGRHGQDRARRRRPAARSIAWPARSAARRVPLRLSEPDDRLVGRRPRPRAVGTPLSLPARATASPSCSRSGRPRSIGRASPPARRSGSGRGSRRRWSRRPTTSSWRRSRGPIRRRARSS